MAGSGAHKLKTKDGREPTAFELEVARAMYAIEQGNTAVTVDLKPLRIVAAREIEIGDTGRMAMVVFVPHNQLNEYRKLQRMIVEELEKKFGDHHVVMVAQRTMLAKDVSAKDPRHKGVRPYSRTLTAVHEKMLDDVVYPADIVGKRTRYFVDGSKLLKVHLAARDKVSIESKLPAIAAVYNALTSKKVAFEFA